MSHQKKVSVLEIADKTKVKGVLKGLRYISQIFENEQKEPEMQIGLPTDVKHVAHIGWDGGGGGGGDGGGPSGNNPSWMSEFRDPQAGSSGGDSSKQAMPEDCRRKGASVSGSPAKAPDSTSRDFPKLSKMPKGHRRQSSDGDSPTKEKSEKKHPKRSSKHATKESSSDGAKPSRRSKEHTNAAGSDSSDLPDIPKKSRQPKEQTTHIDSSSTSDLLDAPKKNRRKKSKDISLKESGLVKTSKSKAPSEVS